MGKNKKSNHNKKKPADKSYGNTAGWNIKYWLKRTKKFIWDDDSLASWIVNIILAFVLVYFIIYPGLGLLLGTSHPVVAVVSGSMEHKITPVCASHDPFSNRCNEVDDSRYRLCGTYFDERERVDFEFFWETCGEWYEDKSITKDEFRDFPLSNGFNTGDIIVLRGASAEDIEVGDVIVFHATKNFPIIHRVVEKEVQNGEYVFTTKGDHNKDAGIDDRNIKEDDIIGKASFRIPYLGWVKLTAHNILHFFI